MQGNSISYVYMNCNPPHPTNSATDESAPRRVGRQTEHRHLVSSAKFQVPTFENDQELHQNIAGPRGMPWPATNGGIIRVPGFWALG